MTDDMTLAAVAYDGYRTIPETIKGIPHVSTAHFSQIPFQKQRAWAAAVDAVLEKAVGVKDMEDLEIKNQEMEYEIEDLKEQIKND